MRKLLTTPWEVREPKNLQEHRALVAKMVFTLSDGKVSLDSETLNTHQLFRDRCGRLVLVTVPWVGTSGGNWVRNLRDWDKFLKEPGEKAVLFCRFTPSGHFAVNHYLPVDSLPEDGKLVNVPKCGGPGRLVKGAELEQLQNREYPVSDLW